ncbi:hypothetical protein BGW36DRAFT_368912 [Talaromyces proteolyticus]|uniref:Bul1 C-terminal domain-containing protein n=1 Tax=Talaromyces proteolyticus TaxID=1131652 RepID=A0AAD4Q4L9_9EURO|nr:uncharacterized protein BGW36DRAFT_368912 [Talaromyces proteolyticus]KAH8703160.1 hypothetical protein BGW36DRAFT_368912 [Talaromyces proteolyticus]
MNRTVNRSIEAFTRKPSRLNIAIDLNDQTKGFVPSYTTFDRIEGEVALQADCQTKFDHIDIIFEGSSKTIVQRQATMAPASNDIKAMHPFLKLRQPIDESSYPEPREFKPRCLYKFPFTFVVPQQMLPQSCSHSTNNPHLKAAHIQLPPSLGDPMLASNGKTLLDDFAPQMTEVSYRIRVVVMKRDPSGGKPQTLCSVAKKIRIVPASLEQPPLEVTCNCTDDYRTRMEKDVRKSLLGKKTGRLVMAAAQPKPLQLPPPGEKQDCSISSHVTVHLRFDPENDEQPPQLRSVWSKLRVMTFYSAHPWTTFPSKTVTMFWNSMQGMYSENVQLSSLCVLSAQWEQHTGVSADTERRSSVESSASSQTITGPSASYSGKTFYTASIIVPINLPKNKAFVPTFHSCLISRVYLLDLSLSYQSPNTRVIASSISLKVPVQITSVYRNNIAPVDASADPELSQMRIEEEFYRPRSIAPPSLEYLEQASLRSGTSRRESSLSELMGDTQGLDETSPPDYLTVTQSTQG